MMKNYYSNYYLSWDWVNTVINNYLNTFTKFDAHEVNVREQVYVGVYGPTQVGKTTFILSLLGINEKYMKEISKALRGEQKKGDSSTVTATMYQGTDEEKFEIIYPNGTTQYINQIEQLSVSLKDFRILVTKENFNNTEEMIIKIPNKYFYSNENKAKDLTIIDLPGDDTKNEDEEEHVKKLLKKYIVLCKSIVIMELGYQVNRLAQIDNELIKKWTLFPERFIVAFTQGVSNKDTKSKIKAKALNSKDQIRDYYRDDLIRALNIENTEFKNDIYFFELGDSLNHLKENDENLYRQISKWNNENFEEILNQMKLNNLPEFRIKNLKNIAIDIENRKKMDLLEMEENLKSKKRDYEKYKEKYEKLEKLITSKNLELDKKVEEWTIIKEKLVFKDFHKIIDKYYKTKFENEKVNYKLLQSTYNKMIFHIETVLKEKKKVINENSIYVVNQNVNLKLASLREELNYAYLNIKKNIFGKSKVENYYYAVNTFNKSFEDIYKQMVDLIEQNKKIEFSILQSTIDKLEKIYNEDQKKAEIILEKINENKKETIKVNSEWQVEIAKVELLDDMLMREYLKNINQLKAICLNPSINSENKNWALKEMNIITNQVKRVFNYGK